MATLKNLPPNPPRPARQPTGNLALQKNSGRAGGSTTVSKTHTFLFYDGNGPCSDSEAYEVCRSPPPSTVPSNTTSTSCPATPAGIVSKRPAPPRRVGRSRRGPTDSVIVLPETGSHSSDGTDLGLRLFLNSSYPGIPCGKRSLARRLKALISNAPRRSRFNPLPGRAGERLD